MVPTLPVFVDKSAELGIYLLMYMYYLNVIERQSHRSRA